jgi:pseudaminic acid synthase
LKRDFKIGTYNFETEQGVFIIAELSANHNGSLAIALEAIKAAKRAGADAIKLQTYTADTLTLDCKTDDFKLKQGTIWDGKYLYDLYKEAYTPWEWHEPLFKKAKEIGLICFSSPFDKTAVDLLEELNTPAYKIASFEITDIPLIEYVASKSKPVIISTGIAGLEDIELAVEACKRMGNEQIILLKCTSSYPAPVAKANLAMIPDLAARFGLIAGLSDHTQGITVPVAATLLGARVIEKHFIPDHSIGSPDASFSLNEAEFTEMVKAVHEAEVAVGKVDYSLSPDMLKSRELARSLYVVESIKSGEVITERNVRSIRPGYGLHPKYLKDILGRNAALDLIRGTPMRLEYIS